MKTFLTATLMTASLALTGCASIMSGSTQTLTFKSVPDTANIVITNKLGEKIHTGSTPATVTLKRGNGYFKPASYDVTFSKEGYQQKTVHVTAKMNGWYIANIVFGGLVGFLIVDPATGAMYSLSPNDVNTLLEISNTESNKMQNTQNLTVMLIDEVPKDMLARAQFIKQI